MSKNEIKTDIAVIGGGASGLCSAISSKMFNNSLKVVILEKMSRVGKKILATGNGRCNLGNKNLSIDFFHGSIENLLEILESSDVEVFFNSLGVMCRIDDEGRIYPYSNHASSVLNALRIKIAQLDINELCEFEVINIEKLNQGFIIKSENTSIYAKKIIISSGGYSAPELGSDGKVMEIVKNMGHKINPVYPSLSALPYKNPKEFKSLVGIRAKAEVTAISNGKILDSETGEIQFSDNGLSGICIFNLSYLVSRYNNMKIKIDFMPEKNFHEVMDFLLFLKRIRKNCNLDEYLTGIFIKNLGLYFTRKFTVKTVSELNINEIKSIAGAIKSTEIEVKMSTNWKNSQVTSGGIDGKYIDRNLQSKIVNGVYFSGEILDVDAKCGGYNLTWAWNSGLWAGRKCAESLRGY